MDQHILVNDEDTEGWSGAGGRSGGPGTESSIRHPTRGGSRALGLEQRGREFSGKFNILPDPVAFEQTKNERT